jgi:uncharacterized protein YndB with AHSA1/START domain
VSFTKYKILSATLKTSNMETQFKIKYQTVVKAPPETVWAALTQPEIVKQYFFSTNLVTTWQVGSPIVFEGEWEGQAYQDKGEVLEYIPRKRLSFTYFTAWSGKEDLPENYLWVSYEVEANGADTRLTVSQTNYDEERASHSAENWASVINGMKKIVEA